ncbi:MAG TPA: hypothetical protein VGB83_09670 [Actinomycetota bacterium]
MRRILPALAALTVLSSPLFWPVRAAEPQSSRVIVSTTLNDSLLFFDASSLEETQPPLPSRGGGPVRLWIHRTAEHAYLLAANHGVEGSVGIFDLDGDLVLESPASPAPARAGSVGITAAHTPYGPLVFVTNAWQALGGCGMPNGSVTAFDAGLLDAGGPLQEVGTVELMGSIPYAVAADGAGNAYASTNCGHSVELLRVRPNDLDLPEPLGPRYAFEHTGSAIPVQAAPDATLFDPDRGLLYVANIGGDSVQAFDLGAPGPGTTIELPGAGPIDASLADSATGASWIVTSNGQDDSISLIDRDLVAGCLAAGASVCDAEVARIPTGVPGGAPEGVDYDPLTNRVFVVNKTIGSPSLSVIQLGDSPEDGGSVIRTIGLGALGAASPLPAFIAFDVVVQTRS